jgi:prepilin peptidase CpaA
MMLTAYAAGLFLFPALPISLWVAWNDMRVMKIPNLANYALLASFAVLGLIVFPIDVYLWQWLNFIVVLLIGILLNAAGVLGAGDAKFAASASPMIMKGDLPILIPIFAASLLAGFVTHRLIKHSALRKLVPEWESWQSGKRFPMGFPLGRTLVFYLGAVWLTR